MLCQEFTLPDVLRIWDSVLPSFEIVFFSSSLLLSSLELSDTQSLCASHTSPPRNRSSRFRETLTP